MLKLLGFGSRGDAKTGGFLKLVCLAATGGLLRYDLFFYQVMSISFS